MRALEARAATIARGAGVRPCDGDARIPNTSLAQMIEVRTYDNNMRLYYLAFFSKNEKGYEFWGEVQKYSSGQLGLGF